MRYDVNDMEYAIRYHLVSHFSDPTGLTKICVVSLIIETQRA